ncbi:uncharacterized protein LOC128551441 [Mercenaria mercenaria]|uniref:uncharacterized protein LOC128551441 n=1 Tax=Mercenaria mercenaria TaxID=6596 RepID=UPI00234F08F4|nr:uncharacterized protein LOC128551441 [Mercenaria mercenaria]
MSAPIVKKCAFCFSLLRPKYYRSLESRCSSDQYNFILLDLKIKNEGKGIKKRALPKTPSGTTPKSKRPLFSTPKKSLTQQRNIKADKFTQTKATQSDFEIKVCVKYQGQERSRILTDEIQQSVVKCILNKKPALTITKHFARDPNYKAAMVQTVAKEINKEASMLPKKRESALKSNSVKDFLNFKWKTQIETLTQKLPTLMLILTQMMGDKLKYRSPHVVVGVCVLLYARCQQLNLLQYILGLTYDRCGLNKEGLSILHAIGLSVSYTSIHNKRKHLVKQQEKKIDNVVRKYVKQTCSEYENPITDETVG